MRDMGNDLVMGCEGSGRLLLCTENWEIPFVWSMVEIVCSYVSLKQRLRQLKILATAVNLGSGIGQTSLDSLVPVTGHRLVEHGV